LEGADQVQEETPILFPLNRTILARMIAILTTMVQSLYWSCFTIKQKFQSMT